MNRYPKSKKKARKIQCADPNLVKEYIFLVREDKKKKEFWNLGLISKANRIELKKAESDTKSI